MIYNTDFKVKYHDIQEELTFKIKNKTHEELQENSDPEYEYSNQDILDICAKLYIDELSSVFYADSILDDKVDIGIKYICEQMMNNNDFKLILEEMQSFILKDNYIYSSEGEIENFKKKSDQMIMLTLFGEATFYIFHKCICQQLTLGNIEDNLLDELKKIVLMDFE